MCLTERLIELFVTELGSLVHPIVRAGLLTRADLDLSNAASVPQDDWRAWIFVSEKRALLLHLGESD